MVVCVFLCVCVYVCVCVCACVHVCIREQHSRDFYVQDSCSHYHKQSHDVVSLINAIALFYSLYIVYSEHFIWLRCSFKVKSS